MQFRQVLWYIISVQPYRRTPFNCRTESKSHRMSQNDQEMYRVCFEEAQSRLCIVKIFVFVQIIYWTVHIFPIDANVEPLLNDQWLALV
ncbi:hypothetical protein NPIL_461151 [Nephila pilipes]|uniref:Uncharacterized protein n=1 Tax=Nephila pilipes TaxID=299642 RepID=A0A8X6QF77_NEPPI|nr:hypothetical protein NPIL_461151 [Nephila pilipes]